MSRIKLIIAGGRNFTDYALTRKSLLEFVKKNNIILSDIEIVSGTAKGADRLGERIAWEFHLKCRRFPADWDGLGRKAGYVRNVQMVEYSDGLLAFWDGVSKGTGHTIRLATDNGLTVCVVRY